MKRMSSTIIVPNDRVHIEGVLDYLSFISKKAGLSAKESKELSVAVKEACTNVVEHAFAPDDDETYSIRFDLLVGGLKVVIEEMGLPFAFKGECSEADTPGLFVIKSNVDRMVFVNRGKLGKKLILCKYIAGPHVSDLFSEVELKEYQSCDLPPGKVFYDIHIMRPDDADTVSRCIYMAYKYSYLKEDLYFPERIKRMNENGQMISAVAAVEKGGGVTEVIAHFALLPAENGKVAEVGVAVVAPEYRGKGIMKAMLAFLIEEAAKRSFTALYGNAYSMHRLSQKTNLKFGFHETAIQLGRFPPSAINTMLEHGLKGSGHIITSFKFLTHGEPVRVFAPVRHKEIIVEIYSELGADRVVEDSVPAHAKPMAEESAMKLSIKLSHLTATISVESVGLDFGERIGSKRVELEDRGVNAIYIDLPLKDPNTPEAAKEIESRGFFFSGVLPEYSNGDVVRFQRYSTPVEYDELKTESDFAAKLKSYIRDLDPRYRALHPQ